MLIIQINKIVNKKVKNATKLSYNNLVFDSKLELYCFKRLVDEKIDFYYQHECNKIELLPKEKLNFNCYEPKKGNKSIVLTNYLQRPMTWSVDFVSTNIQDLTINNYLWFIETKGFKTDAFKHKYKLFKSQTNMLLKALPNLDIDIFLPRSQYQVEECINMIKEKITI